MKKEKNTNRRNIKADKGKQNAPSVTTNTAGRVSPGSTEATDAKRKKSAFKKKKKKKKEQKKSQKSKPENEVLTEKKKQRSSMTFSLTCVCILLLAHIEKLY